MAEIGVTDHGNGATQVSDGPRDLTGEIAEISRQMYERQLYIVPLTEVIEESRRELRALAQRRDDEIGAATALAMAGIAEVAARAGRAGVPVRVPVDAALAVLDPQTRGLHLVEPLIGGDDAAAMEAGRARRDAYLDQVRSGWVEVDKSRLAAAFEVLRVLWRSIRAADVSCRDESDLVEQRMDAARARRRRLQDLADRGVA